MNGTLNVADGRFVLRFEHWLAHPPEKVWAALTDPAAKNRWPAGPGGGQAAEIVVRSRQTACRTGEGDAIMTNTSRCRARREWGTPAAGRHEQHEEGER